MNAPFKIIAKRLVLVIFIAIFSTTFYNLFFRERVSSYIFNSSTYQSVHQHSKSALDLITSKFQINSRLSTEQNIPPAATVVVPENIIDGVRHSLRLKTYNFLPVLPNLNNRSKEDGPGYRSALGYIQNLNETYLIVLSAYGNLYLFNKQTEKIESIDSNLSQKITEQKPKLSLADGTDISDFLTTRSLHYDSQHNNLYASYFKYIPNLDCFTIAIDIAQPELNAKKIIFSNFYTPNFCRKDWNVGGAITSFNNDVYLTIGSYNAENPEDRDLLNRDISGVLKISPNGKSSKITSGLRNPMGITVKNSRLFISDNGPMGGDYFTSIKEGSKFGWPTNSYGFSYTGKSKYLIPTSQFTDPTYYFIPSIAPTQLSAYNSSYFSRFNGKFLLGSLRAKSLFIIDYDATTNRVRNVESYLIGERIRSVTFDEKGFIWLFSDSGRLIKIDKSSRDVSDQKEM
jgi:hypothetical protein